MASICHEFWAATSPSHLEHFLCYLSGSHWGRESWIEQGLVGQGETAPPLMFEGGMQLNHGRINTGSKMEIGHWCDSVWWWCTGYSTQELKVLWWEPISFNVWRRNAAREGSTLTNTLNWEKGLTSHKLNMVVGDEKSDASWARKTINEGKWEKYLREECSW